MNRLRRHIDIQSLEFRLTRKVRGAQLVIADGMLRSGSTLLFNIIRLCLEQQSDKSLATGWIEDFREWPDSERYLIKTHKIYPLLRRRADYVFYTFRDVRDAMVSAQRRFDLPPTLKRCGWLIRHDTAARQYADAVFQYEQFVDDPGPAVARVAEVLGVDVETADIISRLPQSRKDDRANIAYDKQALLHGGHGTGTSHGTWRTDLPAALLDDIAQHYGWWLEKHGYPAR